MRLDERPPVQVVCTQNVVYLADKEAEQGHLLEMVQEKEEDEQEEHRSDVNDENSGREGSQQLRECYPPKERD